MVDLPSTAASGMGMPAPGSAEELRRFARIQERLAPLFRRVFPYPRAPRTVVVVPSLSLDAEELAKISGVHHYEERMLFMLMLLRMPRTHLVFVTSQPVATPIIDYYLHLLPGVPFRHARRRLTLLSCHDASELPLTQKILERPRLLGRIWSAIPDPEAAYIRSGRHFGGFWPTLRRRGPAGGRLPPDRGALRVWQARYLMHWSQPRERRKVLPRHGRDPRP